MAITLLGVIQGHRFQKLVCDFLLLNDTNLYPTLRRFQIIVRPMNALQPVSYTHLTLPTNREV